MVLKSKKCSSTKTKGFGCKELTLNRKLGLCSKCYPKWLYSTNEGQIAISKASMPIIKKRIDFEKAVKENTERKRISHLLINSKNALHAYIRERDKGLRCCACGCEYKSDFQASHFYSSNSFSSMRFNENNIHNTCCGCNLYNEGNIDKFRLGLVERYGKSYVDSLDDLAQKDKLAIVKWDRESLDKIRKLYIAKLNSKINKL